MLPWSEMDSLQLETGYIKDQLVALNRKGFLTINSQPCVNGLPSTDEKVGWGGPNGWAPSSPSQDGRPCAGSADRLSGAGDLALSRTAVTPLASLSRCTQDCCSQGEVGRL